MSQKIYHAAQVENHGVSYLENADFYGNLTGKGLYCLSAYGAEWPDIADSSLATRLSARARALERFFDAVEARNNVCLISYFQALDFSFNAQQHPLTTAKYRQRIASPVYLSSEVVTPPPDTPPTDPADPCKAYKDQVTAYQASIVNLNTQIAQLNANNVILQNTVNTLALKILNVKPLLDQAKAALL